MSEIQLTKTPQHYFDKRVLKFLSQGQRCQKAKLKDIYILEQNNKVGYKLFKSGHKARQRMINIHVLKGINK